MAMPIYYLYIYKIFHIPGIWTMALDITDIKKHDDGNGLFTLTIFSLSPNCGLRGFVVSWWLKLSVLATSKVIS